MPSIERTNRRSFMFLMGVITLIILIFLLPIIREINHWLILGDIHVIISKSDVDYGFSMDLP